MGAGNKQRNIYTRVSLSDVQINLNNHTCLSARTGQCWEGTHAASQALGSCFQLNIFNMFTFVALCNPRLHLFLTSNQPCPSHIQCTHTHTQTRAYMWAHMRVHAELVRNLSGLAERVCQKLSTVITPFFVHTTPTHLQHIWRKKNPNMHWKTHECL